MSRRQRMIEHKADGSIPDWLPPSLYDTVTPEMRALLRRVSPATRDRAAQALAVMNYRYKFGSPVRLEEVIELADATAAVNAELAPWAEAKKAAERAAWYARNERMKAAAAKRKQHTNDQAGTK